MKRGKFILSSLVVFPLVAFTKYSARLISRAQTGFKVNAGEARNGRKYRMKGVTLNVLDLKIGSEDTNGELAFFEQNGLTPNGGPPLHIHLYQDEFFYIVEGDYLFQVGDEKSRLTKGDTIYLPRKVQHAFVQLTEKGKVLVSYMPAGKMESFFKTTDAWLSPPTQDEIKKVFMEHNMVVVGPPLKP